MIYYFRDRQNNHMLFMFFTSISILLQSCYFTSLLIVSRVTMCGLD